jgi:hypothetical protein
MASAYLGVWLDPSGLVRSRGLAYVVLLERREEERLGCTAF